MIGKIKPGLQQTKDITEVEFIQPKMISSKRVFKSTLKLEQMKLTALRQRNHSIKSIVVDGVRT